MEQRPLGGTGLTTSVLGFGGSELRAKSLTDQEVSTLLNGLLDSGITLIDTAHCYGDSENKIGTHLSHRRDEYVLVSKTGHKIAGVDDWTPAATRAGVEESLHRLRTDHLDVVLLHGPRPFGDQQASLLDELDALKAEGKVRFTGISNDGDSLAWGLASGRCDVVECSVNIADQRNLREILPAATNSPGVIAKRPIANAAWRDTERPVGSYHEDYWDRLAKLAYEVDLPMDEFALRFTAYAPAVSVSIVGTIKPERFSHNLAIVEKGPLPDDVLAHVAQRWQTADEGWDSLG
ncbi:aldo/keto reductase [Aestuariimicrobium kwangyangense]|uniref:aldo/keto reductase n=1 Tax=Aestuariimicrobium kwangyangense TaxID=396389 RepID=UPI0003B5A8CB|nr:aldo/keto reductase [Aestuariimicrobium kwangyangense]